MNFTPSIELRTSFLLKARKHSKSSEGVTERISPVLGKRDSETPIPRVVSASRFLVWKQRNSSSKIYF